MISEEIINEVRAKTDIVDLISSYIPLEKKGKNYFGVCPFHDDHTPSMSVSPEKQIYTCFTCGASGNAYRFVMDYENIGFKEAVKILANKVGIPLNINEKTTPDNKKEEFEALNLANKFFQNNLNSKEGIAAKEYLLKRGFDNEIIKKFNLGLATNKKNDLYNVLKNKYEEKKLEALGLINKGEKEYYDVFIDRIIIPIEDSNGNIIGFSGRTYKENDKMAKYINSKETKTFKKGETLYNIQNAKTEARRTGKIILMEGYFDVIGAYNKGITNTIATMGTALTKEQANIIKKLAKETIICYDGDNAGKKATIKAANELEKINGNIKIISLNDKDPDEYLKEKGKETFLELVENAITPIEFKIKTLKENTNFKKPDEVNNYIIEVTNELNKLNDLVLAKLYINKIAEETEIEKDLLLNKLNIQIKKENQRIKAVKKESNVFEKAELTLLYFMLKDKEIIKRYENNQIYLTTIIGRALANELIYYAKDNKEVILADFLTFIQNKEELLDLIGKIEQLIIDETNKTSIIEDVLKKLEEFNIKREITRLEKKLTSEDTDEDKLKILEKISKLRKEGV